MVHHACSWPIMNNHDIYNKWHACPSCHSGYVGEEMGRWGGEVVGRWGDAEVRKWGGGEGRWRDENVRRSEGGREGATTAAAAADDGQQQTADGELKAYELCLLQRNAWGREGGKGGWRDGRRLCLLEGKCWKYDMSTHDLSWLNIIYHNYSWCIMTVHDSSWSMNFYHDGWITYLTLICAHIKSTNSINFLW